MFLAHFTGSGLNDILELNEYEFFPCLEEALKLYEIELTTPRRVILAGIERK